MTASTTRGTSGAGEVLAARVARAERALAIRSLVAAACAGFAIVLVVLGASALLLDDGRWLALPRIVPIVAWVLGAAGAVAVGLYLRKRDRERLSHTAVAISIEEEQALRTGSLRGALEVAGSGALGAFAAADVERRLAPSGALAPKLEQRVTRMAMLTGASALGAVALFVMSARASDDGIAALRNPVAAWRGLLLPPLGFSNLPENVPRGMPLTLRIDASGRTQVQVRYGAAGEPVRDTALLVDGVSGQAALPLGPVTSPVSVQVSDGRSAPVFATIAVADRGWIGDITLHASYPGYLQRVNGSLESISPVRVPRGTVISVRAMLRGGAVDATLSNGRDTVQLDVDASESGVGVATGRIVADHDTEWRWSASPTSRDGSIPLPVEVPDPLQLIVVPDHAPRIAIVAPSSDTTIGSTGAVGLVLEAVDDHGLSNIALQIWKESDGTASAREELDVADPALPMWGGGMTIPLDKRDLQPGDKLHVVAIATDDSPWRQKTESAPLVLRVPSLSEQRAMARELAESLAAQASQMAAQEKQLQEQTMNASRSRDVQGGGQQGSSQTNDARSQAQRGRENSMSYAAAERARELARQQQQLGQKVDSLRQSSRELEERLKSAGALDAELQQRMREVQQLLREAMTPEMQKQLEELQKSADRLSGSEAQQSLQQLAEQQRQMREQLEKSAEMLQRAALEGAMQTLSDEAKELAKEQQQLADKLQGKQQAGDQKNASGDPRTLADRTRALERDVDRLAKRLDDAGAKQGATGTKAAQPMVDQAADAMQRAAQQTAQANQQKGGEQTAQSGQRADSAGKQSDAEKQMEKALQGLQDKARDSSAQATKTEQKTPPSGGTGTGSQAQQNKASGSDVSRGQTTTSQQQGNRQGQQQGNGQQGMGQRGENQAAGGQRAQQSAGQNAQQAANSMERAAQQLSDARDAQVSEWKGELAQKLDQSISETQQLARQQAQLEERAKQEGAQNLRGEQSAIQQGVQQAASRLEEAGRSSSLLSQRSQRAMGEAQRKVQDATQAMANAQAGSGQEAAQSAMREATEALNQALGSLVRDRERVNNAQSGSGFTEMMEQLKQLAQQQGSLNGQMQGLSMLPGGMQGQQAQQQARMLARQQREVARTLQDVSDMDASGRTDALAREAQQIAQQMERTGVDPAVAARQQQLYRRLLDAGRFLEQDERDDQGPREARAGTGDGRGTVTGPSSGRNANKFAPPTWNELRGLGPEERRLVIEYFRRINGNSP